jgi:hypothetical protein
MVRAEKPSEFLIEAGRPRADLAAHEQEGHDQTEQEPSRPRSGVRAVPGAFAGEVMAVGEFVEDLVEHARLLATSWRAGGLEDEVEAEHRGHCERAAISPPTRQAPTAGLVTTAVWLLHAAGFEEAVGFSRRSRRLS